MDLIRKKIPRRINHEVSRCRDVEDEQAQLGNESKPLVLHQGKLHERINLMKLSHVETSTRNALKARLNSSKADANVTS